MKKNRCILLKSLSIPFFVLINISVLVLNFKKTDLFCDFIQISIILRI